MHFVFQFFGSLQLAEKEADTSCSCRLCGKRFSTKNAYDNHLQSKKHREVVAREENSLPTDVQSMNDKNRKLSAKIETEKGAKNALNLKQEKMQVGLVDVVPGSSDCGSTSEGAVGTSADVDDNGRRNMVPIHYNRKP